MRKPALCKMLKHRLGEYLSEKCVHTHVVRKLRPFIYQKLGHSFTFFFKKGVIIYLAALKKGALRHAHPFYAIYEGHPINRGNLLIIQEFVPVKHRTCNH